MDAEGNAKGYDFTTGGVSLGIDYRINDQLAIGVMGDYSHTWTALQPNGHIDADSGRGGLYATWYHHGIYLNGAIYGGHNTYDSSRASLGGLATGGTEGAEWSTFISGGYDFHFGQLTVGPIAALQYTDVEVDGFSEKGSLAPLDIHSGWSVKEDLIDSIPLPAAETPIGLFLQSRLVLRSRINRLALNSRKRQPADPADTFLPPCFDKRIYGIILISS